MNSHESDDVTGEGESTKEQHLRSYQLSCTFELWQTEKKKKKRSHTLCTRLHAYPLAWCFKKTTTKKNTIPILDATKTQIYPTHALTHSHVQDLATEPICDSKPPYPSLSRFHSEV